MLREAARAAGSVLVLVAAMFASAQTASTLPRDTASQIDAAVQQVLADTGVPSATIAVIKDGKVAYVKSYGKARLDPAVVARPEMRYSIGSVSKQFTATAVLMLAEDGKLALDDPVAKFLPDLTRAQEVTIRQLLSHTAGYQDYWPQDYVPPFMLQPTTASQIMDRWARKPLDFDPGTKWQYSNTNFVIAGAIIEKASGMPLLDFLTKRIFAPLGMTGVANVDQAPLGPSDPTGYMRYALGPPRVAPKEGKGWLFAAGELAMPVGDLAKWDLGLIEQRLLKPASYKQMETATLLKNGLAQRYGLGISVGRAFDHRVLAHDGEVSGYTAENMVFPDDRAAVIVLCNQDSSTAMSQITGKIAPLLFADTAALQQEQRAEQIFQGLQQGKLDRSLFTDNGNSYFTAQAIQDFASSLSPLGKPQEFKQVETEGRGGMIYRRYNAKFPRKTLMVWTYEMPDGKLEQYQVAAAD
jgi:CubicO group peptidase (beta-lactamase class C family)